MNFLKKACYNIFLFCVSRNFLRISRKFRTNFNFVFRDIFAKLSENFAKLIISRNFRENTKTKIFAATINCSHILKKKYSLSRQGEACRDKIDAGKTPRSVSQRGVTYFANLSAKTNRSAKPF